MNLKNNGLGSLTQIAEMLWKQMLQEIDRDGYSDLTLAMEGAVHGINEIIEMNDIED